MSAEFSHDPREVYGEDFDTLEERNRLRLSGWWDLLAREPEYPTSTAVAVELCRATEYAVDADWVLAALSNGWVPPVPREAGRLKWDATAIISLASAAEARRKWQPFSQIHGHKLTQFERLREVQEHKGQGGAYVDLAKFDFDGLLGLLIQFSKDHVAVEALAEAMRQKLRAEGIYR